MIIAVTLAFIAGALIILSRQINGRLAQSTSAMESSFWNHIVGLAALTLFALIFGGLFTQGAASAPWWAYLGGIFGVIFIASGSWLIPRLGAANTTIMIIAGQMISGVVFDIVMGTAGNLWARILGTGLIFAGMWFTQTREKS